MLKQAAECSSHEHIWIQGPEYSRRYGTGLTDICTECGIYKFYDWYGGVFGYKYYDWLDFEEWDED